VALWHSPGLKLYITTTTRETCKPEKGRFPDFRSLGVFIDMQTNDDIQKLNDSLARRLPVLRRLEDGLDYQPDWRFQLVQQYLADLAKDKGSDQVEDILNREQDEGVLQLLRFHEGGEVTSKGPVEYAVRLASLNLAAQVKAMVIAGRSVEKIAKDMTTDPSNIEHFEKLYFDVRRYLEHRAWLRNICQSNRLMMIAFNRGSAGLAEVLDLDSKPKEQRTLEKIVSVSLQRAQDWMLDREISNSPVGPEELACLELLMRAGKSGQLPYLRDFESEPVASPIESLEKLTLGERDKVRSFMIHLLDTATLAARATEDGVLTPADLETLRALHEAGRDDEARELMKDRVREADAAKLNQSH
jgi:hypothetical protein